MNYIGIDPGKSGAIVVIDKKGKINLCFAKKVGKDLDLSRYVNFIKKYSKDSYCVIEDVHSIFGAGAKSNFQFGRSLGMVEAIIATLEIPFTKVAPKKWQKEMWEGIPIKTTKKIKKGKVKEKIDTKATSETAAKRLFPKTNFLPTERSKKNHDGAIDAALIALYAKRNF